MIRTWKINADHAEEVPFADQSSLDAVTRQLPDGYFSTFRTYGGGTRVIGLSAHLQRLPNLDASSLRRQLFLLLKPFRPGEARVRVMMTFNGQVYLSLEPLKLPPVEIYENGVCVETTSIRRDSPRVKSTAFIGQSDEERRQIAQKGIFEALLVKNGRILEGMTSNFFYVPRPERDVLFTAQRDILLGVTRRMVIRVARGEGMGVRYVPLHLNQLAALTEAFITSSSRGVLPVVEIDHVRVGQGRPGRLTKHLANAYDAYVNKKAEIIWKEQE